MDTKNLSALALLPRVRIQNANIISSPLTWGFPAITNFLGAAHKIDRDLDPPVTIASVGVVCHKFQPQVSREPGAYSNRLHLYRMPVNKDGSAASRVDEGRGHMEISLVLGIEGELEDENEGSKWANLIYERLMGMRLASGSVLPGNRKALWEILPDSWDEKEKVFRKFRHRLLPGFALVERRDLLAKQLEKYRDKNPDANVLDAFLDSSRINWEVERDPADPEKGIWTRRGRKGWIVPIPAGYRAISKLYEPGEVKNARDNETPFRFVESLYTLGEWKSPHRISSLNELLWRYDFDEKNGAYLCVQK
ncbi:MAG: type I-F CRISPR-associated protein Csy2 [Desulfovibrio sp.]|nr:type I-F CRISPR-associated protein Csy2 [Desulfovibrio sp.]